MCIFDQLCGQAAVRAATSLQLELQLAAVRGSVLWVEDVRGGRVIDDDSILEIPTNLGEILSSC